MATGDLSHPYDVKFTLQGQDPVGFMLSVPKEGTKQVMIEESAPPNLQRDFDEFSEIFRNSNPRNDTPFVVNDLSGGVGQLFYDEGDPTKYLWSTGVITHVKGKAYPASEVTNIELNTFTADAGKVYTAVISGTNERYDFLFTGTRLFRMGIGGWTQVWIVPAGEINGLYFFNNIMFIFGLFGGGVDYYYHTDITDPGNWGVTPVSAASLPQNITWDGVSIGETMYIRTNSSGGAGDNVFFSTTPTTGPWTGPIVVGPPLGGWAKNRMIAVNNIILIMNDHAIYSISADQETIEVVWQFKDNPSEDNFKHHAAYNSELIFNVRNDIYSYNPLNGNLEKLSLSSKDSFSVKSINGISADSNFLYILATCRIPTLSSLDQETLFAAHKRDDEWKYEILWNEEVINGDSIFYEFLTCSRVEDTNDTRLYWTRNTNTGADTSTNDIIIPSSWDGSDGLVDYQIETDLYTSITKARFPGLNKLHTYLDGTFGNLDADNTIEISYTIDVGDNYVSLITANEDSEIVDYDNVSGSSLGLKFTFVSDNGSIAPILFDVSSHQRIRFRFLPTITLAIRIGNELILRNNNKDKRKVWDIWEDLVALRTTDNDILYEDFYGNQFNVTVNVLQLTNVKNNRADRPELEAMMVITRKDKGD